MNLLPLMLFFLGRPSPGIFVYCGHEDRFPDLPPLIAPNYRIGPQDANPIAGLGFLTRHNRKCDMAACNDL